MKKPILVLVFVYVLSAAPIFAQGRRPSIADRVAHQVKYLTTLLDLLPAEVQTATTAFTTAETNNQAVEPQLRAAHQALEADIQGSGGNIATDAASVAKFEAEILANNATAEQTFYASLDTTQQAKYKQIGHGGFGRGFGGPGRGGPDGPGPGGPGGNQ